MRPRLRPVPRTTADIITRPGKSPPEKAPAPVASGKWLTASVTDDIPAVIAAGFAEAERRDPARGPTWIALVDGNKQQIEAIEAEAASHAAEVTILIDLIHVLEYLWGAAWTFFETGDPAAEEWVAAQATKILESKSAQVAAGIRRRATTYGYSAREREGADKCAAYLTAKKPYLGYATALAAGWPIATGIIEGACRHIVKDRMDITGARWGLDGAEAILKLRAINSQRRLRRLLDLPPAARNTNASTTRATRTLRSSPHDQLTLKEPHPTASLTSRIRSAWPRMCPPRLAGTVRAGRAFGAGQMAMRLTTPPNRDV